LGSVVGLSASSLIFYCGLILVTGDPGGPLLLPLIPSATCAISSVVAVVLWFPVAALLEWLGRRLPPKWNSRLFPRAAWLISAVLLSIVGIAYGLLLGTICSDSMAAKIFPESDRESIVGGLFSGFFLGGMPLLLGGPLYWLLLRSIDKMSEK